MNLSDMFNKYTDWFVESYANYTVIFIAYFTTTTVLFFGILLAVVFIFCMIPVNWFPAIVYVIMVSLVAGYVYCLYLVWKGKR